MNGECSFHNTTWPSSLTLHLQCLLGIAYFPGKWLFSVSNWLFFAQNNVTHNVSQIAPISMATFSKVSITTHFLVTAHISSTFVTSCNCVPTLEKELKNNPTWKILLMLNSFDFPFKNTEIADAVSHPKIGLKFCCIVCIF